jgi:hypothetical protein
MEDQRELHHQQLDLLWHLAGVGICWEMTVQAFNSDAFMLGIVLPKDEKYLLRRVDDVRHCSSVTPLLGRIHPRQVDNGDLIPRIQNLCV